MKSQIFKNLERSAALVANMDPAMRLVAEKMADLIRATTAPHTKTGAFASSVRVRQIRGGVRDWIVEVTDPQAEHIEYGHTTRQSSDPDEHANTADLRWVPGLRIVSRAYAAMR